MNLMNIEDQLYREEILEIIRDPRNRGTIQDPDLEATLDNPLCGDEIRLQIKLNGGRIGKVRFSGGGCAISQASADLLAQSIEGKNLNQVRKLRSSDILELLGINPTPTRRRCALLSLEVLKEAFIHGTEGKSR